MSQLETILINTYNPDFTLRTQAEAALNQFLRISGACFQILLLAGNHSVHRDLRQAAKILLKNKIRSYWSDSDGLVMSPEEKVAFKNAIIEILIIEPDNSIKTLIAETIKIICEFEFEKNTWPDLIPKLIASIRTSEPLKIYNSLLALRKLIKRYEYKPKEGRAEMNAIIDMTFPTLHTLIQVLRDHDQIEAAGILRLCFKIFWSATQYCLPNPSSVDFTLWFSSMSFYLDKPLPEASENLPPRGQPTDPDQRAKWPWWQVRSCFCHDPPASYMI